MKALAIALDDATSLSLQKVMSGHGVDVERASAMEARVALEENRYAAIFLNCDEELNARETFGFIQSVPHNRAAVVVGVARGTATARTAMRLGMMFVIQVPIATEMLSRHVKAAYALMVRRRPRSERIEAGTNITLRIGNDVISAKLANVSETGLRVEVPGAPKVGTALKFTFTLPDLVGEIDGAGAVVWSNTQGQCGIRIQSLAESGAKSYSRWLESRLRPTEVRGFFQQLAASVQHHS
jgi:PilZ domain